MIDRRAFLKQSGATATVATLGGCSGYEKIATVGVPRSDFDADSTAEEVTEGIDLSGKLAVVTGCTSGIGFETMRVLAQRGALVVGTSRSLEKARAACSRAPGLTSPAELELSDYESIVNCANAIRMVNMPLDILVCNAGYLGGSGKPELVNGVEKHFAINHLGHYVFVNRLLGRLYMSWQGRIVVVASRAAYTRAPEAGIELDNLGATYGYDDLRAYGQSKLANVLFALQLGRLLRGTRITANALHPGVINTEIDRNMSRIKQVGFALLTSLGGGKTIEEGAATSCFVATSPLLGSTSGRYFEDCNAVTVTGNNHMHDESLAEELWRVSENLTRDYLVSHDGPDLNDYERAMQKRKSRQE
ncbi:MAG: SDR family NAD(P)-dependent oxidoreductase [Gammaproteobacteria bacterium]|nr:SDR family NAD(P)-dependent oxidoreductase [Gammaproteobacteria bacterium]MDH3374469.1 SDR family NAD(P)-dependent oxidoreductase [Gammaproteobacteria bacterium]MDH3409946.1 SDR family NAD(P)-dependent oxidoreductase [Gammaproteobacteria bacterium]